MKAKTIGAVITKKFNAWLKSIDDEALRRKLERDTICTGGCIASMLMREKVSDFDFYFATRETAKAIAEYYVNKWKEKHPHSDVRVNADEESGRVSIFVRSDGVVGDAPSAEDEEAESDEIDEVLGDYHVEDSNLPKFRPVFMSSNAITLSDRVQLIVRFWGAPDKIHENYDFIHCKNYWTPEQGVILNKESLESIITRELRYVGSLYPICSLMRMRKFVRRGWTINAGQVLKMCLQISELNLKDLNVLEEQLTGVDVLYFQQLVEQLRKYKGEAFETSYAMEMINRMF